LIPTGSCLWFSKVKQRCVILFFPYLNFYNKSGKRFFSILKLLQQKWKEMCSSFFILKLYQREWNRVKIHFTIPKFSKVIDPYPIMSLVFDSKKEMWSVNVIKIIYILVSKIVCLALCGEWNRVKIKKLEYISFHFRRKNVSMEKTKKNTSLFYFLKPETWSCRDQWLVKI